METLNDCLAKKDDALVARLNRLLADAPVNRKSFFGNVAWYHDLSNQMCVVAWGKDIALRIGQSNASDLIESGQMAAFDPSGHQPKREYVLILDQALSKDELLRDLLNIAIKYAELLPLKAKKRNET